MEMVYSSDNSDKFSWVTQFIPTAYPINVSINTKGVTVLKSPDYSSV